MFAAARPGRALRGVLTMVPPARAGIHLGSHPQGHAARGTGTFFVEVLGDWRPAMGRARGSQAFAMGAAGMLSETLWRRGLCSSCLAVNLVSSSCLARAGLFSTTHQARRASLFRSTAAWRCVFHHLYVLQVFLGAWDLQRTWPLHCRAGPHARRHPLCGQEGLAGQ